MASKYMNTKTNVSQNTTPIVACSTITATGARNFTVDLEPGRYAILMCVTSSVTGTTATLGSIRKFTNQAQTQLDLVTNNLRLFIPSVATTPLKTYTSAAAASGTCFTLSEGATTLPIGPIPIQMLSGFQFTVSPGTAVAGEKFEVIVLATKLG